MRDHQPGIAQVHLLQPGGAAFAHPPAEEALASKIAGWLEQAGAQNGVIQEHARAIIGPHAGYRYCGHVMAHAYAHIDPAQV